MDVPESMLDEIESQFHSDEERKTAVLRVCLADHPKPTWELVSDVVYMMKYHSVLERLQSLFPTGEHLSVPHISTLLLISIPVSLIPIYLIPSTHFPYSYLIPMGIIQSCS